VKQAIADVAKTITDGIKNLLGIHSPSRVMIELGQYTGEGMAVGLGNSLQRIRQQASALASSAIPVIGGMSSALSSPQAAPSVTRERIVESGGVNITIQSMSVRNDNDIKLISQELHRLSKSRSRSAGVAF
jgi:hypothetical protein